MPLHPRAAASSLSLLLVLAATTSGEAATGGGKCPAFRILKDGRQVPTDYSPSGANAWTGQGRAGASSAQAGGTVSSSSSVHVSSSSRGGGGSAKAVASYTDERGRTVTRTSDEHGCRIVIDERGL